MVPAARGRPALPAPESEASLSGTEEDDDDFRVSASQDNDSEDDDSSSFSSASSEAAQVDEAASHKERWKLILAGGEEQDALDPDARTALQIADEEEAAESELEEEDYEDDACEHSHTQHVTSPRLAGTSAAQQTPGAGFNAAQLPSSDSQPSTSMGGGQHMDPPGLGFMAPAEAAAQPPVVFFPTSPAPATDAEEAIWQRTRARKPLEDVSIADLEAMLTLDADLDLLLGQEEEDQYQDFLAAVRGEPAAELPEDDLEDADFELDWSELLPGEAPGQGLAQAQNQATGQQALQPSAPRPRTRAQHRRVARELESTARLRDRQLRPLLPCVPRPPQQQMPVYQPGFPNFLQHTLAVPTMSHTDLARTHQQCHAHVQLLVQGCALARLMGNAAEVTFAHIPCVGDVDQYSSHARSMLYAFQSFSQVQAHFTWSRQTALPPLPDAVAGCRGAHPEPLLSCSQVAPLPLLSAFFSALDAQPQQPEQGAPPPSAAPVLIMTRVESALERFNGVFDPNLYPRLRVLGEMEGWTAGEDELFAQGLRRFGMNMELIQRYLLPSKTPKGMHEHQKARSKPNAPDNPIKAAKLMVTGPLTDQELAAVEAGLRKHSKAARKWELICQESLVHRTPKWLPRLYNAALEQRLLAAPASAEGQAVRQEAMATLARCQKRRGRPSRQALADRQAQATRERLAQQQGQHLLPASADEPAGQSLPTILTRTLTDTNYWYGQPEAAVASSAAVTGAQSPSQRAHAAVSQAPPACQPQQQHLSYQNSMQHLPLPAAALPPMPGAQAGTDQDPLAPLEQGHHFVAQQHLQNAGPAVASSGPTNSLHQLQPHVHPADPMQISRHWQHPSEDSACDPGLAWMDFPHDQSSAETGQGSEQAAQRAEPPSFEPFADGQPSTSVDIQHGHVQELAYQSKSRPDTAQAGEHDQHEQQHWAQDQSVPGVQDAVTVWPDHEQADARHQSGTSSSARLPDSSPCMADQHAGDRDAGKKVPSGQPAAAAPPGHLMHMQQVDYSSESDAEAGHHVAENHTVCVPQPLALLHQPGSFSRWQSPSPAAAVMSLPAQSPGMQHARGFECVYMDDEGNEVPASAQRPPKAAAHAPSQQCALRKLAGRKRMRRAEDAPPHASTSMQASDAELKPAMDNKWPSLAISQDVPCCRAQSTSRPCLDDLEQQPIQAQHHQKQQQQPLNSRAAQPGPAHPYWQTVELVLSPRKRSRPAASSAAGEAAPSQQDPVWDRAELSDDVDENEHPPEAPSESNEGPSPSAELTHTASGQLEQRSASPGSSSEALAAIYRASVYCAARQGLLASAPPGQAATSAPDFDRIDLSGDDSDEDPPCQQAQTHHHAPLGSLRSEEPLASESPAAKYTALPRLPQLSARQPASSASACESQQTPPAMDRQQSEGHAARRSDIAPSAPAALHVVDAVPALSCITSAGSPAASARPVNPPWTKEEDMTIFKATIVRAGGRPNPNDFARVADQLQGALSAHLQPSRSTDKVQQRFHLLQQAYQHHCSRQMKAS